MCIIGGVLTPTQRMHPYLAQEDLKAYCDAKGIRLVAYTATGTSSSETTPGLVLTQIPNTGYSGVLTNPLIVELAAKYGVTPAQVVLAWHLARGVGVVPKSAHPQRQKDNLNVSCCSFRKMAYGPLPL